MGRRKNWDAELDALALAERTEDDAELRDHVCSALACPNGLLVARAANIAQSKSWREHAAALQGAFELLLENPVKRDPGCLGKLAVLDALDHLEHADAAPFLLGWTYVQKEPAYGRPVDTAGGVRSRSAAALARLQHPDTLLILARLLADPDAAVRRVAASTLAYHGAPAGAAPLVLKLAVGDDDPMVIADSMAALLDLQPQWAIRELERRLAGGAPEEQELVSIVLGQHRSSAAIELLIQWFESAVVATTKATAVAAIGLHRSDRARAFLLDTVKTASEPVAVAAIEALSIYRHDGRLREETQVAAAASPHDLEPLLVQFFERS